MNLDQTLVATLRLPRAALAAVGWADLAEARVPMPINWVDADVDAAFATSILRSYGIGPGDHCLVVSAGREHWPRPVETGAVELGAFIGNIGPAAYEDRRLGVYLRYLAPKLVVGITEQLAVKAVRDEEIASRLKVVPHVLCLPNALKVLREAGIAARAFAAVGPALALPCALSLDAHVDASQFTIRQLPGSSTLSLTTEPMREFQLVDGVVATEGTLLGGCACGLPGPLLRLGTLR